MVEIEGMKKYSPPLDVTKNLGGTPGGSEELRWRSANPLISIGGWFPLINLIDTLYSSLELPRIGSCPNETEVTSRMNRFSEAYHAPWGEVRLEENIHC